MATTKSEAKTEAPKRVLTSQRSANIPDHVWEAAKDELKLVKGRFRLLEKGRQGGSEKVTFRKYPPEICPMFSKSMQDGAVYEIPLYAARFINGYDANAKELNGKINSCATAKHGFKMSHANDLQPSTEGMTEGGMAPIPVTGVAKYDRRMAFESLEFSGDVA